MNKILFTLFIGIFLISLVSSIDDAQMPQICGGDDELLIGCLGDDELTFLAGEPIEEPPWGVPPEIAPEYLEVPEPEIPEEEVPFFYELFSIFGLDLEMLKGTKADLWIVIFLSLIIILIIFASRRRKKKEQREKKKDRG